MTTTYLPADDDTLALAKEIIAAYHPHLNHARIAIVFRDGDAPTSNGKETLGQTSLVTSKMQVIAKERFDFLIWLAGDWWHEATDSQRRALLDHELCHCGGEPYAWKLRGHDVQEFACILDRHGPWYRELHNFINVTRNRLMTQADLLIEEMAGIVGTLPGRGIESVELATKTRSVTLTADTARKASAMLAEIVETGSK